MLPHPVDEIVIKREDLLCLVRACFSDDGASLLSRCLIHNDHRYAKTIETSIVFAAERHVWLRMILRIIRTMLIAMNRWQNSGAVLLSRKAARRNALWRFAII